MLSIGPYVVVREISTQPPGLPADGAGRTYRATDRLTGLPVLLHPLFAMTGVPELPPHPALLPFADIVVQAGEAFLVTELPPNAVPAREPISAARGALLALTALHERGLAHGGVNTAQLWSVDGPVRLAGGGRFELGAKYTVARDLQALAVTLDELGGLPPILSPLRTEPERLSAREALELLQTGEGMPTPRQHGSPADQRGVRFPATDSAGLTRQGGLPNLDPLSLLNPSAPLPQTPSSVSQAVWTTTQEPGSSTTDPGLTGPPPTLPFKLDISQWDVPDFMQGTLAVTPLLPGGTEPPAPPAPTVTLGWQNVTRPLERPPAPEVTTTPDTTPPPPEESPVARQGRRAKAAAQQALQRLKTDGQRLRQLQELRRDEAAAQLGELEGQNKPELAHHLSGIASGEETLPDSEQPETPQERRRREHQARLEEEQLAGKLVEKTGPAPTPPTHPAAQQPDPEPVMHRQRKSVKMRWDEGTNSWQRVDGTAPPSRTAVPVWVWPLVALAALLVIFLGSRAARSRQAVTTTPATCCTVEFQVNGGSGQATVSLVNTTSKGTWKAGQVLGQAPGKLNLPGQGTYRLQVTSEGFTPATLDVTVPRNAPVTIHLGQ